MRPAIEAGLMHCNGVTALPNETGLGWSFGFVVGRCFRRTESEGRPPRHRRTAAWRQSP